MKVFLVTLTFAVSLITTSCYSNSTKESDSTNMTKQTAHLQDQAGINI